MQAILQNIVNRILALLVVLCLGYVLTCMALYSHAHILGNGQKIIHFHPYQSNGSIPPAESHNHTLADLASLSISFLWVLPAFIALFIIIAFLGKEIFSLVEFIRATFFKSIFNKGPPALVFG